MPLRLRLPVVDSVAWFLGAAEADTLSGCFSLSVGFGLAPLADSASGAPFCDFADCEATDDFLVAAFAVGVFRVDRACADTGVFLAFESPAVGCGVFRELLRAGSALLPNVKAKLAFFRSRVTLLSVSL